METTQTKPTLWSRDFILMTFTNLLMSAGSFLLIPTLPIYAANAFDASKSEVGYIIGIYTLSALFLRPIAGIFLDTVGRKPVYLLGLFLFVLMMPLYIFVGTLMSLILLRFAHGVSWGTFTTSSSTIVSDIVPPSRRGEGIGYFGMSFTVAMAVGPVLGLTWLQNRSAEELFILASFITLGGMLLAFLIRYPKIKQSNPFHRKINREMLYEADCLPTTSISMICSAIYGGLITFISLFMQESKLQTGYALLDNGAVFFIAYAFGLTIIRPLAGRQLDLHGPLRVLSFGFLGLMLGLMLIASSSGQIAWFIAGALVSGIGMGAILPTTLTMIVNIVPPERRGVANSTFFSGVDIGVGVGAIALGAVAEVSSIQMMYYLCAVLVLIPMLSFLMFINKDYEQKFARFKEH